MLVVRLFPRVRMGMLVRRTERVALGAVVVVLAALLVFATVRDARADAWRGHQLSHRQASGVRAIRSVWRAEGRAVVRKALRVAWCESRFQVGVRTKVRNSSARGLFQLLDYNRRRYGDSHTARGEARAGLRMWKGVKRHWVPYWSCGGA